MTDTPAPSAPTSAPTPATSDDPYLWLEDVEGTEALAWVAKRNAEATEALATSERFGEIERQIREVLDSADKIPAVSLAGDHLYNVWKDAEHERGLWRRTSLTSYRTDTPEWDVLLDLDELSATEGVDWVFHGAQLLRTGPLAYRRALVDLSRGGSDADETREFDLETRTFVTPEDGGFYRAEAKGGMSWIDGDTVFVATADDAETTSGYPRRARRLTRGQQLADAPVVFEGEESDLIVSAHHDRTEGFERDWVSRALTFWTELPSCSPRRARRRSTCPTPPRPAPTASGSSSSPARSGPSPRASPRARASAPTRRARSSSSSSMPSARVRATSPSSSPRRRPRRSSERAGPATTSCSTCSTTSRTGWRC